MSMLTLQAETVMMAAQGTARPKPSADVVAMRKTAEDFEAFFLSQMMQPMFAEPTAEEPFGGGPGEDMWKTLQVDEYGKAFARNGGVGIADSVFREMLKLQEVQ